MKASLAMQEPPPVPELSVHARYLLEVLRVTRLSANALAEAIAVPASTLARHLPNRGGTAKKGAPRSMHADVVRKLEAYSGVPAPSALTRPRGGRPGSASGPGGGGGFASDSVRYRAANDNIDLDGAVKALIGNRPHAEDWTVNSRALEIAGILPGDLLIVDRNAPHRDGDLVCASRRGGRPHEAETLFRLYRDRGGMKFLIGASLDPQFMDPIPVDGDQTQVMGKIIHVLRPLIRH